jgi:hypothetical protein
METNLTAIIVIAQGHDIAGRRKTCARASTANKSATWKTTAHEFAWKRVHHCALDQDRVSDTISMSGMIEPRPDLRRAGEG